MKAIKIFIGFFIILFLFSCEKEITFNLPDEPSKFVIEGWIEQGQTATVIITKSAPYFSPIDSATLFHSIVQNAVVTVSDGVNTETLIFSFNPAYYPYLMYTGSSLKGEVGKTYYMTAKIGDTVLTAQNQILPPVTLDSVWFKLDQGKDSLGYIFGQGSDNAQNEDYYRMFTKRLHKDEGFVPMFFGSVWEDKYFNGQTFTFQVYRGEATYLQELSPEQKKERGYFKLGDTVVVKLCTLDYQHFLFWRTYESELYSGGNPFSNPTPIKTNISGGGLGIWGGYGASYDTVVCK